MSPSPPLPENATIDQKEAERIARDPQRLNDSFAYWNARFSELGENTFNVQDGSETNTPFIKLLRSAPQKCLVSIKDIAKVANPSGTEKSLFEDLFAFGQAAQTNKRVKNPKQISRGIRYAREIYDAICRFRFCQKNKEEFQIPFSELLSLYYQEGILAITPSQDSYKHAPLIETRIPKKGEVPCRSEQVQLWSARSASRPGFILVYEYNEMFTNLELQALRRNLQVTGGLDCIVTPNLRGERYPYFDGEFCPNPKNDDELITVMNQSIKFIYGNYLRNLNNDELGPVYKILLGLAMAELDRHKAPIHLGDLRAHVENEFSSLMSLHKTVKVEHNHQWYCCLVGNHSIDSDGFLICDTFACLRVQARWYSGCCFPYTLLAWQDRREPYINMPRFTPFLSYLRFHRGDTGFMTILCNSLIKHKTLASKLAKEEKTKLINLLRDRQERLRVERNEPEDMWRHHGLIDACEKIGACPKGVYTRPSSANTILREISANLALEIIRFIYEKELLGDLNNVLQDTMPSDLLKMGIAGVTIHFENAHDFEKRRKVYAKMVNDADLSDLDAVT